MTSPDKSWHLFLKGRRRRFPVAPPLLSLGYLPGRLTTKVDELFPTLNFSVVLSGAGHYRVCGRSYRLETPCVIMQWPGEPVGYGPDEPGQWEECYLNYGADQLETLREIGFFDPARPIWPVSRPHETRQVIRRIQLFTAESSLDHAADHFDMMAAELIMWSLEETGIGRSQMVEKRLLALREELGRRATDANLDIYELVRARGYSRTTFQRKWAEAFEESPSEFIARLRMEHATELLVSTPLAISEIAERCGFRDPYYFSRVFRRHTGMPATHYRTEFTPPPDV